MTIVRRCRPLLGTLVEVAVPEGQASTIDMAFAAVAHVHVTMSFHSEDSDLARLRRAPAGAAVRVDRQLVEVLRLAARLHARSNGLFDVTVAHALVEDGFLPCPPGLDTRRMCGTADDIMVVDDESVCCLRPLLIDLGGIAKGFAVDRAIEGLRAAGVEQALVNAGGDLRVLGVVPQAIHLRAADGQVAGMVMLADMALASSANLLDRHCLAGRVVVAHRGRNHLPVAVPHAVSVVAPSCAVADAMTKIVLADTVLAHAMLGEFGGGVVDRGGRQLAS